MILSPSILAADFSIPYGVQQDPAWITQGPAAKKRKKVKHDGADEGVSTLMPCLYYISEKQEVQSSECAIRYYFNDIF